MWCARVGGGRAWLRCVLRPPRGAAVYRAGEPTVAMLEAIGDDATGCARGATLEAFLEHGVAYDVRAVVAVVRRLLALATKGVAVTIGSSVDDGDEGVVAWHARPDDADDPTPRRTPEAFATAVSDRKAARFATVPRSVPRSSVSLGETAFRRMPRRTAATRVRRREVAPWA